MKYVTAKTAWEGPGKSMLLLSSALSNEHNCDENARDITLTTTCLDAINRKRE